ncbi:MAG: TetR/AcrR family transcriptional regulator [Halanaerobiales bacterium]|nr:TetR/AcrR family transcriptional regulator [Halanaerobiales bacterium]
MIEFDQDDIKTKNIIRVFIDSTIKILRDKGLNQVKVRKVAKISGYNPATIYNYFDNSKQLIFFASLDYMREYFIKVANNTDQLKDPYQIYIKMWDNFCQFSYKNPEIYYSVFVQNIDEKPSLLIDKYFILYPEDFRLEPSKFLPLLTNTYLKNNLSYPIRKCVEGGYLNKKNARTVDEMNTFFYHGMLSLIYNSRVNYSISEATERTLNHIKSVFKSFN